MFKKDVKKRKNAFQYNHEEAFIVGTCKIPFIQSRDSLLPLSYFPWFVATLLCYCVLTQVIKQWYIGRFSRWL